MNTNPESNRTNTDPQASLSNLRNDTPGRVGNRRMATLKSGTLNGDQIFGAEMTARKPVEKLSDKAARNTELRTGAKAYRFKPFDVKVGITRKKDKKFVTASKEIPAFLTKHPIEPVDRAYREISVWKPAEAISDLRKNDQNSYEADLIYSDKIAMYEHAAQLRQFLITWILVANGGRAQIYERRKITKMIPLKGIDKHHGYNEKTGHEFVPVTNGAIEAESTDNNQVEYSRRGAASRESATHESYGDIKEEFRQRFIRTIIGKLRQACTKNSFDRLILVAPAKMIGELRRQLDVDMQNRGIGSLPKNFAYDQDQAVMPRLNRMLAEVHDE